MLAWKTFVNISQLNSREAWWRKNVNNLCCRRHNLSNILKVQAAFLYSIYHQRAGKANLFHMRGVDFTHFNTCCPFNHPVWMCDERPPKRKEDGLLGYRVLSRHTCDGRGPSSTRIAISSASESQSPPPSLSLRTKTSVSYNYNELT